MVPEGLRYTAEHEWITATEGDPSVVRVGITDYAQDQLGDVVFVQLPDVGASPSSGDSIAEVESTKSVSEIYAPLAGEVTAVNDALSDTPELINSDPFGSGWMFELRLADAGALDGLLDAAGYQKILDG
ncbi:glycine cleavage system H protein [Actinomycetospora sp. NBRC 106375]|uniref:glycine cleavage system protein GcvH n=1 Tax=Actinomycetospora sp. NBRC 106375 TaxID=3032207 RepID=UPI0024A35EE2|nr:glycine cleavage system protein GcvH [Actinomycetospora sp. NBRC 106375]GLZ43829.1 glycine cleavage system H protein [Actinomycetospora sp. NBRC 106375]